MKIVFETIPMQVIEAQAYKADDNKAIEYDREVVIPMNGVLARILRKGERVKVVRVITEGKFSDENARIQRSELEAINESIGADIEYVDVRAPFEETGEVLESRFRQLVSKLEDGAEILLDMTYGSKTLTPVLFYVLGFAEKFFDADIKNIIYGRVLFGADKKPVPGSARMYDVTALYYLNSLTSVMEAPDSKTALERLDMFFAL